jgi:hypothetical protein
MVSHTLLPNCITILLVVKYVFSGPFSALSRLHIHSLLPDYNIVLLIVSCIVQHTYPVPFGPSQGVP